MSTVPQARVVIVDGIPMSGLLAEVGAQTAPKAVIVALHGGATTAAYFDCPGHPGLSLLRSAPDHGFTVLALDRPGFGSSALYGDEFDSTPRRIEMTYHAVDAILGPRDRGAGVFVLAHSNGSELALRMAADDRGRDLLGLEFSGTGLHQQDAAAAVLATASRENIPTGLRELLWEPADLYPPGVSRSVRIRGGPVSPGYEGDLVSNWRRDLPDLAARIGGEEFAIILPHTPLTGGIAVAQSICKSITTKELKRKSTGETFGIISVSIGVATLHKATDDAHAFIERADKALYRAKSTGRNRVIAEN